jgi:hypothetical protein
MTITKTTRRIGNKTHHVIVEKTNASNKRAGFFGHIAAILHDDVLGLVRHAADGLRQAEQLTAYTNCMNNGLCSDAIESKDNYLPPIYDETYTGNAVSPTPGMATVNAVKATLKDSADLIATASKAEAYANRNSEVGKRVYEEKAPIFAGIDRDLARRATVVEEVVG